MTATPASAASTRMMLAVGIPLGSALLWKVCLGGQIVIGPITYMVEGRQYVSVIAGHTLVTFGLRE